VTRGAPTPLARRFIDFVSSPEGQQIVATHDFVSVP
jgi:ABC-type Fe3+ transport system substrate-binding protein